MPLLKKAKPKAISPEKKENKAAPEKGGRNFNDILKLLDPRELFAQEADAGDIIEDEADTRARNHRLMVLINAQAIAIGILVTIVIFSAPLLQPINRYFSQTPSHESNELVALFGPNLTNNAILSWASTSVTEVMTIGFGDFDRQIRTQRKRFTSQGWDSFRQALTAKNLREAFKSQQLVLTTVPSDVPVVVGQGEDPQYGYQWRIEVPIIMNFVTNNNVSKKSRVVVRLTIVRVPSSESIGGIAIQTWDLV